MDREQWFVKLLEGDEAVLERLPLPLLKDLLRVESTKQYLLAVKEVLTYLKSNEKPEDDKTIIWILVHVYLSCDLKNPVRRVIASFFTTCSESRQELVRESLAVQFAHCLQNMPETAAREVRARHNVNTVYGLMENFPLGEACLQSQAMAGVTYLADCLDFFHQLLGPGMSPVRQNEVMHHCLSALTTTNKMLQKCFAATPSCPQLPASAACTLLTVSIRILQNDDFLIDARCNSGMIIALVLRLLNKEFVTQAIVKGEVDKLQLGGGDWLAGVELRGLTHAALGLLSFLCLVYGLLAMVDAQGPSTQWLPDLAHLLLELTTECSDNRCKVLVARALTLWTTRACAVVEMKDLAEEWKVSVTGGDSTLQRLLSYVWTTWDDQLEVLRQNAKSLFENIVKIHCSTSNCGPGREAFLQSTLARLLEVDWCVRGKYGALGSLAAVTGVQYVMDACHSLPAIILAQMKEQTLASYASELYGKLSKLSKAELGGGEAHTGQVWLDQWVTPVAVALCGSDRRVKAHVIEYILPRLLKEGKRVLQHFIHHLSSPGYNSSAELGALVMCLRRARSLGVLSSVQEKRDSAVCDSQLWHGLVSPQLLQYTLSSADEQIRLDAYALLCESVKTSEVVTKQELDLIKFFLPLNLNNQTPAFRQRLLSYTKKCLLRLKESGATLARQRGRPGKGPSMEEASAVADSYTSFLEWLQQHLFCSLLPGAAFARRTSCLALLCSLLDTFGSDVHFGQYCFVRQVQEPHIVTLLECLTDTFEENKVAAFHLLSALIESNVGVLTARQLEDLLDAGFKLAVSTKPQDGPTAAFLFKYLLLQPGVEAGLGAVELQFLDPKAAEETIRQPLREVGGAGDGKTKMEPPLLWMLRLLLTSLQKQIRTAQHRLMDAAMSQPLYPTLHCIRSLLEPGLAGERVGGQWSGFLQSLIQACLDVAAVVSPVVQNSSPEGNIPDNAIRGPGLSFTALMGADEEGLALKMEQAQTLRLVPEFLVVCCWRSIKEVSLLLADLVSQTPGPTPLSYNQVLCIGSYFITQLLESKHRGAFELAYAGFVKVCHTLWRSPTQELRQLPEQWLSKVMADIQSENSNLCATRRSAGVPFYIQALVTTQPATTGRHAFHSMAKKLLELALQLKDPTSPAEPQSKVHALNVLRALYRDTRLGQDVAPYVADGLKAAILGFKSDDWAIRNSSTLLLSALMTRVFGVKRSKDEEGLSKKNCQTGRAFFHRYPSLYQFLLDELKEATSDIGDSHRLRLHPCLYPVLMLLGRLFPSALEGSHSKLDLAAFLPLVQRCASSPVFKTRLMAARALQPLVPPDQMGPAISQLMAPLPCQPSLSLTQNLIHGILLQMQHLLQLVVRTSGGARTEVLSQVLPVWLDHSWLMTRRNPCLVSRTVALEVTDLLLVAVPVDCPDSLQVEVKRLEDMLGRLLEEELQGECAYSPHSPGLASFQTVRALLTAHHHLPQDQFPQGRLGVMKTLLNSVFYEARQAALLALLQAWTSMNSGSGGTSDTRDAESAGEDDQPEVDEKEEAELFADEDGESHTGLETGSRTSSYLCHMLSSKADLTQLYSVLVSMVMGAERRHTNQTMVLALLARIPPMPVSLAGTAVSPTQMFQAVVKRLQDTNTEDVQASLVEFSGHLLPPVYEVYKQDCDPSRWQLMQSWAQALYLSVRMPESPALLTVCARVLLSHASLLLCPQSPGLGNLSLLFWDVLFTLLQDDDLEVKDIAAKVLTKLDPTLPGDVVASLAVERLLDLMLAMHWPERPVACLLLCMKWFHWVPNTWESNSCRVFDKGEMNTYHEPVLFIHEVVTKLSPRISALAKDEDGSLHLEDNVSPSDEKTSTSSLPGLQKDGCHHMKDDDDSAGEEMSTNEHAQTQEDGCVSLDDCGTIDNELVDFLRALRLEEATNTPCSGDRHCSASEAGACGQGQASAECRRQLNREVVRQAENLVRTLCFNPDGSHGRHEFTQPFLHTIGHRHIALTVVKAMALLLLVQALGLQRTTLTLLSDLHVCRQSPCLDAALHMQLAALDRGGQEADRST